MVRFSYTNFVAEIQSHVGLTWKVYSVANQWVNITNYKLMYWRNIPGISLGSQRRLDFPTNLLQNQSPNCNLSAVIRISSARRVCSCRTVNRTNHPGRSRNGSWSWTGLGLWVIFEWFTGPKPSTSSESLMRILIDFLRNKLYGSSIQVLGPVHMKLSGT